MPKPITKQQKKAIRNYIKQGYSSTKIQKNLSERHIGLRRKTLLAEIRTIKHQEPKTGTIKYIPKKYAKARWRARAKARRPIGRHVVIIGIHNRKEVRKERYGSGKNLYNFVKEELTGDYWDAKPTIHS